MGLAENPEGHGKALSTDPPNDPWSYPPPSVPPPSAPPPPPGSGYPGPGYPPPGYPGGGYPGGGYPGGGYPGGDPSWGQPRPTGVLAGWWHRVGATILDGIIISIPVFIITFAGTRAAGFVVAIAIEAAYFTYMLSRPRGQTIGNMAVGTRVVDARTGGPLSTGKALGRWAAQFLFGLGAFLFLVPTLIDYLWPLWDSQNQTLHDKMAGTVVIRN